MNGTIRTIRKVFIYLHPPPQVNPTLNHKKDKNNIGYMLYLITLYIQKLITKCDKYIKMYVKECSWQHFPTELETNESLSIKKCLNRLSNS